MGESFFHMSDIPEDPNYGEDWEMWDGGTFRGPPGLSEATRRIVATLLTVQTVRLERQTVEFSGFIVIRGPV